MTNTPFSKKCAILADFASAVSGEDWTKDFFDFHDLGIPFAIGQSQGYITIIPNTQGEQYVNDTWIAFCDLLGIDHYGDYDSLAEIIELQQDDEED